MNRKKINNTIGIIFILFLIGGVIYGYWLDTLQQTYTVGIIHDWYKPLKGGHSVNFEYTFQGIKYESFSKVGEYLNQLREGDKYLVSIPKGHPKAGKLLLNFPVPEDVLIPKNGWNEIPEFIKKNEYAP